MMNYHNSDGLTLEEIKKIMVKENRFPADMERELIVTGMKNNGQVSGAFLHLNGTPPHGYGIYEAENRVLHLFTSDGQSYKHYRLQHGITDLNVSMIAPYV